jgi:uncharacterized protein YwgA
VNILYALAYTLKRLGMNYKNPVGSLDERIILQKTIYLLKVLGYDLNYHFTWYIMGPYSPSLANQGFNIQNAYKSQALGEKIDSWITNVESDQMFRRKMQKAFLPNSESAIDKFKELRGKLDEVLLSPAEIMEVAASLIFIYECLGCSTRGSISQFLFDEKPDYRTKKLQVRKIYDILSESGLVPP